MAQRVGSGERTNGRGSRIRSHGNCIGTRTNRNQRTEVKDSLINVMLRTSLYASRLHTQDRLVRALPAQEWVCAEAFPISTSLDRSVALVTQLEKAHELTSGTLPRFIIGPSATFMPFALNSFPIAMPRFLNRLRCQVDAAFIPGGKTVVKSACAGPTGESWTQVDHHIS